MTEGEREKRFGFRKYYFTASLESNNKDQVEKSLSISLLIKGEACDTSGLARLRMVTNHP
jgi:hypothetical protein